jgi:diguanylate cyclase (GGDEF)-like protein
MEGGTNWLIAEDADRRRMLEMDRRLKPIRLYTFAVLAVAFVICAPWIGWQSLPLLLFAGIFFQLADRISERAARPEAWIFAAWVGAQLMIAGGILLTEAPATISTILFALPVVTLSARFSGRGVITGVAITLVLLIGVSLLAYPQGIDDYPPILIMQVALIMGIAILSTALMGSDRHYREESVVDPLTGLLNRKALANRAQELSQQSLTANAPIGLVSCDLDHFKRVNDTAGHPTGDIVLKQIADVIRDELRAFELAYRIGGEEFLVLIPGLGLAETTELAERLRAAVGTHVYANGIHVTMSLGVTTSCASPGLDFESLWASVDAALYAAKREGRNQVIVASAPADRALIPA